MTKQNKPSSRVVFGGIMGVGKTTLELELINIFGANNISTYDEVFFTNNALNSNDVDFTQIVVDAFNNTKPGQFSDACLHTHLICESVIFNKDLALLININNRIGDMLSHVDQVIKDTYCIIILKKSWLQVKENIYTRNRAYEIALIEGGLINESVYELFYSNIQSIYSNWGYHNVHILDVGNNRTDTVGQFLDKLKIYGGI